MLGQRICELRTASGWSQVDLAKKLGVAKQTVSNWENENMSTGGGKRNKKNRGKERELQRKRILTQCGEVKIMRFCEIVARWLSMRILNRNILFFFLFFSSFMT